MAIACADRGTFFHEACGELDDDDLENMGIEGCLAMAIYALCGNLG